ncbi:hypothetical protein GJA_5136 [Janthinobacterium agaricidamnosum NBRC 102515 = DSM 9628]|uniref:Uncharacterized protein n=1 Tax=Janthinobacterium agaricidamnosum NBRC 102515 = DSM 9628 TaxID=1349767 RepID=W0VE92_9BURK|nr:hypothetical protein GJA_5136 [Janthinobacterium agaricidamnosum NBRC 102515 = DSM 9628]
MKSILRAASGAGQFEKLRCLISCANRTWRPLDSSAYQYQDAT